MKTHAILTALLTLSASLAPSAAAEPWTRGFVISFTEPAAWFGGKTKAISSPGSDCPTGSVEELNFRKILATPWRSKEELERILDPENGSMQPYLGFRGPEAGKSVYQNLESVPDVGMKTVKGKIAEGFNLDGDTRTGFTSPDGKTRGIDNNFYRAWGCWEMFRGPQKSSFGGPYHNDDMRNGKFTIVMLLSGTKDPDNDDNVSIGLYSSKDAIVKDATGEVARDYSYRVDNDPAHASVIKGKIRNGVVEVVVPQDVRWQEASLHTDLTLYSAMARFKINDDGTLEGMIGGYKPISEAIGTWIKVNPPGVELVSHVDLTAAWYAIKRFADARPDPVTGQNTAVSTAIRYWAVPAFVIKVDGTGPMQVATEISPPSGG